MASPSACASSILAKLRRKAGDRASRSASWSPSLASGLAVVTSSLLTAKPTVRFNTISSAQILVRWSGPREPSRFTKSAASASDNTRASRSGLISVEMAAARD